MEDRFEIDRRPEKLRLRLRGTPQGTRLEAVNGEGEVVGELTDMVTGMQWSSCSMHEPPELTLTLVTEAIEVVTADPRAGS